MQTEETGPANSLAVRSICPCQLELAIAIAGLSRTAEAIALIQLISRAAACRARKALIGPCDAENVPCPAGTSQMLDAQTITTTSTAKTANGMRETIYKIILWPVRAVNHLQSIVPQYEYAFSCYCGVR
jgi:hypothetical protein